MLYSLMRGCRAARFNPEGSRVAPRASDFCPFAALSAFRILAVPILQLADVAWLIITHECVHTPNQLELGPEAAVAESLDSFET